MQVDSEKAPVSVYVQIGDDKNKIQDAQKGPMILEKIDQYFSEACVGQ